MAVRGSLELIIISILHSFLVSHVRHHQRQAKVWLDIKGREIQEKKKLKIEPIPIWIMLIIQDRQRMLLVF